MHIYQIVTVLIPTLLIIFSPYIVAEILWQSGRAAYRGVKRSREQKKAKAQIQALFDLLNDPTAFRVTRKGWENMQYIPDPLDPTKAIAIPRPARHEPSREELNA